MSCYKKNQFLNEQLYTKILPSGLICYIIPKKGFIESQAILCTRYGSIDNTFIANGTDKHFDIPAGVAHFLEHKMFEDEKINIFEEYAKLNADVNAFTSFTATAYYFNCSCSDNFEDCLKLLLDFVGNPYFTDDNVEKEKGIIEQEISMYEDNPNWVVYFQMLRCMYDSHPIRENIAGTTKSIKKFKPQTLYDCYKAFYHPQNMAVICVGDIEPESITDLVNSYSEKTLDIFNDNSNNSNSKYDITRDYGNEPPHVRKCYECSDMNVPIPQFCIGFKENRFDTDLPVKTASTKILLDILAGESGDLFGALYDEGLIDENFSFDYNCGLNFGHSVITGSSKKPEAVHERIIGGIDSLKKNGIDENRFERIKKKHIGRFVRGFNYIDAIASSQIDYFTKKTDILDVFSAYEKITLKDVSERLFNHLNMGNSVLSVIK